MLPTVLYHLLTGRRNGLSHTVDDWIDDWATYGADDARLARCIYMALWLHPAPPPPGIVIQVERSDTTATVHYGVTHGQLATATMDDLVAAARIIFTADEPPSWPTVAPPAPPKPQPVQMSLF